MNKDWKLTAEQLQDMLLVRKVISVRLLGETGDEDEASESTKPRRAEEIAKDSQITRHRERNRLIRLILVLGWI